MKRLFMMLTAVMAVASGLAETQGTYYLDPNGVEGWVIDYTYWKLGSTSGAPATEDVNPKFGARDC